MLMVVVQQHLILMKESIIAEYLVICAFLVPSSKSCAEIYGEGPDAVDTSEEVGEE